MPVNIKAAQEFLARDRSRREELGLSNGGGQNTFKTPEDGDYEVRVLGMENFMIGIHWGVLKARQGKKSGAAIKCPKAFDNSPCPVCEWIDELMQSEDANNHAFAKELELQIKYPMLVLDLQDESGEPVVKVYEAPWSVYNGVIEWCANPKFGDITDFKTGRNITIKRTTTGVTRYQVQPDPDRTPVDVDESSLPNLMEIFAPRSYEDIQYAIENGELPETERQQERGRAQQIGRGNRPSVSAPSAGRRAPTAYGRGLPAPKTQDEEPESPPEDQELPPDDETPPEEQEVETEGTPASPPPRMARPGPTSAPKPLNTGGAAKGTTGGVSSAIKDRLAALKGKSAAGKPSSAPKPGAVRPGPKSSTKPASRPAFKGKGRK